MTFDQFAILAVSLGSIWGIVKIIISIIMSKYKLPPLVTKILQILTDDLDDVFVWIKEAAELKTEVARRNYVADKLQKFAAGYGFTLDDSTANLIVEYLYNKYKTMTAK